MLTIVPWHQAEYLCLVLEYIVDRVLPGRSCSQVAEYSSRIAHTRSSPCKEGCGAEVGKNMTEAKRNKADPAGIVCGEYGHVEGTCDGRGAKRGGFPC